MILKNRKELIIDQLNSTYIEDPEDSEEEDDSNFEQIKQNLNNLSQKPEEEKSKRLDQVLSDSNLNNLTCNEDKSFNKFD